MVYVESLMKKRNISYAKLCTKSNISYSTLLKFQNGAIPREATVKKMAIPLRINPDEIIKLLPFLNVKTKKVEVTIVCAHCGQEGKVLTARPNWVKYPHKKCASKASGLASKRRKAETKEIRDADKIKLSPEDLVYIMTQKKKKKTRICLSCERKFLSRDSGNRICKVCSNSIERNSKSDRRHKVSI